MAYARDIFIRNENLEHIRIALRKYPDESVWMHLLQGEFDTNARGNRISLESRHCHGLAAKLRTLIDKKKTAIRMKQHDYYPVFRKSFVDFDT